MTITPERLQQMRRFPRDTSTIEAIPELLAEIARLQAEVTATEEQRDVYRDRSQQLALDRTFLAAWRRELAPLPDPQTAEEREIAQRAALLDRILGK